MSDNKKTIILDCTLRDGGYVNNWEFDRETALAIIDGLYQSGIRWIEIGIMGKNPEIGKQTKFSDFEQMKPFLENRKKDCHYAVMVTTALSDNFEYPICGEDTPDIIRIAFFKPEVDKTFKLANKLKSLGYHVFLQAMATFMYTESELRSLLALVNALDPTAFYMVDSFGTMYPDDVVNMRDLILSELNGNILFGFHAHNNLQMAFANVQKFMETSGNRILMADANIFGIGGGAGNVPLELLLNYLNVKEDCNYNVSLVLSLYHNYIEPIYKKHSWGYSIPYCLTAINSLASAWGWYFINKGITEPNQLEQAFSLIPRDTAYRINREIGEKIIEKLKG